MTEFSGIPAYTPGLPRQLIEAVCAGAVAPCRERLQGEARLPCEQRFATRLGTLAVVSPAFGRRLQLLGHQPQPRSKRFHIHN